MRHLLFAKLAAVVCGVLIIATGCSNRPAAGSSNAGNEIGTPRERSSWLCAPSSTPADDDTDGARWACDQYAAGESIPKPEPLRLKSESSPNPSATAPVPVSEPSGIENAPFPAQSVPSAQPANLVEADAISLNSDPQTTNGDGSVPIQSTPHQSVRAEDADIPEYVALSFQPDEPVAILDLPRDFFAIQVIALASQTALEKYAVDNDIRGMSAARIAANDNLFYVLLLGIYETRSKASAALASIPEPYTNPWIRSVGSLQDAMIAGDKLAGAPIQ